MDKLFVTSLIKSWIEYIDYTDRANYRIQAEDINDIIIELNQSLKFEGNFLLINNENNIFSRVQNYFNNQENNENRKKYIYFPVIYRENEAYPLVLIDAEYIFEKDYQQNGWDLSNRVFFPAIINIIDVLQKDEDDYDVFDLIGLVNGIEQNTTLIEYFKNLFNITFPPDTSTTLEDICNQVFNNGVNGYQILPRPSFCQINVSEYNRNLKKDLKNIKRQFDGGWITIKNLAFKYIYNKTISEKKEYYYGDLRDLKGSRPTKSQADILYLTKNNDVLAVQGPPGSGKTTLILKIISNQIVKRAISLAIKNKDVNNFTVIASTNNRAVQNVIEKLNELNLGNNKFYLEGGNQEIMQSTISSLNNRLDYLNQQQFNETELNSSKQLLIDKFNLINKKNEELNILFNQNKIIKNKISEEQDKLNSTSANCQAFQDAIIKFEIDLNNKLNELSIARLEQIDKSIYFSYLNNLKNIKNDIEEINESNKFLTFFYNITKTKNRRFKNFRNECSKIIQPTFAYNQILRLNLPDTYDDIQSNIAHIEELTEKIDRIEILLQTIIETQKNIEITKKEIEIVKNNIDSFNIDFNTNNNSIDEFFKYFAGNHYNIIKERYVADNELDIFNYYYDLFYDLNIELFNLSLNYLQLKVLEKKDHYINILTDYKNILNFVNGAFAKFIRNPLELYSCLSMVFPIIITTLQSLLNIIPYCNSSLIDCAIIDEAAMVHNYQSFPLAIRSDRIIFIGDPFQILPINTVNGYLKKLYKELFLKEYLDNNNSSLNERKYYYLRYSPTEEDTSSYHLARVKDFGKTYREDAIFEVKIKDHFRCQERIVKCFNKIVPDYELDIKTATIENLFGTNLIAYHIQGKYNNNNTYNIDEIKGTDEIVQHLLENGYNIADIGVLCPYKFQYKELKRVLTNKYGFNNNQINTIHTIQGGEFKIVICTTKIYRKSEKSRFLNNKPNILNVAISRAKELFILVGNLDKLKDSGGYTRKLVEFIENNGKIFEINPVPKEVQKYKNEDKTRLITNCEHIKIFNEIIKNCENELIIVCPWIRDIAALNFYNLVKNMNYNIKIYYGWKRDEIQDVEQINRIRQLNNVEITDLTSEQGGTHEKIVIADRKIAIVGSWNWLSHKYFWFCKKEAENNLIVRNETSIYTENQNIIKELLKRIVKKN